MNYSNLIYLLRFLFLKLSHKNIEFNGFVRLGRGCKFTTSGTGKIIFNGPAHVKEMSRITVLDNAVLTFGRNVTIGHHTEITTGQKIDVGDDFLGAAYVYITDQNHGTEIIPEQPFRNQAMRYRAVNIANNVWIARGAIILPSSNIGSNAVIGSGSVISGWVPSEAKIVNAKVRNLVDE